MSLIQCDYCLLTFKTTSSWLWHIIIEAKNYYHNHNIIHCLNCGFRGHTFEQLRIHLMHRSCRGDMITKDQCHRCDKFFTQKACLTNHLKNNICSRATMGCIICDQTFGCKSVYDKHIERCMNELFELV